MNKYKKEYSGYQNIRKDFWNNQHAINHDRGGYYHRYLNGIYSFLIPEGSKVLEIGCGKGGLLSSVNPSSGVGVDFSERALELSSKSNKEVNYLLLDAHDIDGIDDTFDYIIISDLINDLWDIQLFLEKLRRCCSSDTRIIFNFYSRIWGWPLKLASKIGLASPSMQQNWLTLHDVNNLLEISGFQSVASCREVLLPIYIPIVSNLVNRYVARIYPFNLCCLTNFVTARVAPKNLTNNTLLTTSVIIAARNEEGHIEELIERMPNFGGGVEIIFVEGNSSDNTYEKIEQVIKRYPEKNYKLYKQDGIGKGDAVRKGFDNASGDILMILDADITVPPEELTRFYALIQSSEAEFVNGVRLVYPMQNEAMRPLNFLGNKFFSWAFSWLLGQPIRDTLCGTKVLRKKAYKKIADNRFYFGDFDPFGDFDLLFGAAKLNLKIAEVPVRYRAREYGETNISRWSHGWLLLKMVFFASRKIKFFSPLAKK